MQLRDYIEQGATKAGSLTALGKMLDMSQPTISAAKAHRRPLTNKACFQLADFIGADLKAVIAANELVTEKDEEKRAFWFPFVQIVRTVLAALALGIVTNFATPSPANASASVGQGNNHFYYVKLTMKAAFPNYVVQLRSASRNTGNCRISIPSSFRASHSSWVAWPWISRGSDS